MRDLFEGFDDDQAEPDPAPAAPDPEPAKPPRRKPKPADLLHTEPESLPYVPGSETSKDAADFARGRAVSCRRQILNFIQEKGPFGATIEEAVFGLKMKTQTVSARMGELFTEGYILKNGNKRLTVSKCEAEVYIFNHGERVKQYKRPTRAAAIAAAEEKERGRILKIIEKFNPSLLEPIRRRIFGLSDD